MSSAMLNDPLVAGLGTAVVVSATLLAWGFMKLRKLRRLLQEERAGRTRAEKQNRQQLNEKLKEAGVPMMPIGFVKSPFTERCGSPRQGILAPTIRGQLQLNKQIPPASLEGLQNYTHIWIIFLFHENTNAATEKGSTFPAKVAPPQLKGERTGLFSTRTPHRPNPIGLTVVRLDAIDIDARTLELRGVDIVNNTPVLDIKPYIPAYDSLPDAVVPSWILEGVPPLDVTFSDAALEKLEEVVGKMKFCTDFDTALLAIEEVLRLDIRSVRQGRGTKDDPKAAKEYNMFFDILQITFETTKLGVFVKKLDLRQDNKEI